MAKVREESQRKSKEKMQVREKIIKPRNTMLFHWFVAPEDRKEGLLNSDIAALSACQSQNAQSTSGPERF